MLWINKEIQEIVDFRSVLVKIFKFFLRLRFISKMGGEYSELSCSLAMKEKYKLSVFQALLEL